MTTTDIISSKQKPFEYLCNNKKFSDIEFIVGKNNQQQRIPAHKLILAARSAVFEAMFFGDVAESDEIEINDVEPIAFLELLKFFYTNEFKKCPETVLEILDAATKYDKPPLESLLNKPQAVASCLDFISKNTMDVLEADSFTHVDLDTLIFMLEQDTLQVFESKLFEAIVLWSKAECARTELPITPENQRSVLGPARELIRFHLMTLKEFIIGPVQSGLLDGSEIIKYSLNIASNTSSTGIPRCIKTPIEYHLKFDDKQKSNIPDESEFKDTLKCFRPVVIVGFVLCSIIIEYKSNVLLTLKDEKEDVIRCCVDQCNNSDSPQDLLRIKFNKPVLLLPDNSYQLEIKIVRSNTIKRRIKPYGDIYGYDGEKLENLEPTDYFSFPCWSGIISQIIFYVSHEME